MAWVEIIGFEPMTFCVSDRCANQLCHISKVNFFVGRFLIVEIIGFEPMTFCVSDRCANQLRHISKVNFFVEDTASFELTTSGFKVQRSYLLSYMSKNRVTI
jgi:hypothetical protein